MKTQMQTAGFLAGLVVAGALIAACSSDSVTPPPPVKPPLQQREQVLLKVEAAYNNRKITWYDSALDANFTFFLAPGDVGGGLPDQWDRAAEITANTNLLNKNYAPRPCQSVFLDIRSEDGITWIGFNPASAPTETWYTTTLEYTFKFEIAPDTYIPLPGSKAAFTVRNAGTESAPHWQLVEMRDLGGASALQLTSGTQPSTLGQVKALYRN